MCSLPADANGEGAVSAEPLRERKKASTRQALEAAALRLFGRNGYDATTVEQIAEAAEVSVRTFYRYFDSKDAVLLYRFEHVPELLDEALAARDLSTPTLVSLITAIE